MAIQNDFTIYPKTKVIRHTSGTSTYTAVDFYSWLMNTFDEPGYLTYETPIRFNTPTSFTMINGWFLDNGDGSNILKYLYGGGIDTSGYATVSDPIIMADLQSVTDFDTSGPPWDKDLTVKSGTDVGPLLAVKNDYPTSGRARIWVRDTNSHGALATSTVTEVTTAGGTGTGTTDDTNASDSGDEIYLNLFTIASLPTTPDPQVYIYQRHPVTTQSYNTRVRIAEWSHLSNWDRDPATDPTDNFIDVLFPIQLGGDLIDSGNFKTFVRQTGDTFTFVESTIVAAGRTPIAIETAPDEVNITKGEYYLLYDGSDTLSFSAGDVIQDVATGGSAPPSWYAEVVDDATEFSGAASGVLRIRALNGTITDDDDIYVGTTLEGTVNGLPGDTYVSHAGTGTEPVPGDIDLPFEGGTSGAHRVLKGYDNTANKLVMQAYHTHGTLDSQDYTGSGRNALYMDFSSGEVIDAPTSGTGLMSVTTDAVSTTLISGYSDITVTHINGTITTGSFSGGTGTFTLGERVTWGGGGVAWVVDYVLDTSLTVANVDGTDEPTTSDVIVGDISGTSATASGTMTDTNTENYAFTLQSAYDYSVFIEGGSIYNAGRSLSDIYAYLQYYVRDGQNTSNRIIYTSTGSAIVEKAAEEYIRSVSTYSATKVAPFGTLAGTTFFGAQGVWLQGMQAVDNNNIKFIDHGGNLREPDPSINLVISNTRVGDRIAVYLESGSTTLPNKQQYNSHATLNAQGDSTFDRKENDGAFPIDTPSSGTFIAVDTSASEEHRYRYDTYNATGGGGSDGQLVLPTKIADTSTGGGLEQLIDTTGRDFGGADDVQIGDIVRQTTDGGWGYVTAITTSTTLAMTLNSEGNTWDTKGYEINALVATYNATDPDYFFIPYMDFRETIGTDGSPGSETVTVLYLQNREVVIEARNVESSTQIIPFKTTGTITSTGLSQSVIRNEDTVYT